MITVRPALATDAHALFEWRNDPGTRAASISQDEVIWEDHVAWLERSLASASRRIYLADDDDASIGMVRFDLDERGTTAEVSINLAPSARGSGLSGRVLAEGIRVFGAEHSGVVLVARIRVENLASTRLFSGAGFVPSAEPVDGVGSYVRHLA